MVDDVRAIAPIAAPRAVTPVQAGPVFLVGMPRSGTKLLRGLLNQSPRIAIPDIETDFFPFLVRWVEREGEPHSQDDFARIYAELTKTPYFARRDRSQPFSVEAWRSQCEHRNAAGLFAAFVRCEVGLQRADAVRWGDKSPAYIRHVELLLSHFQDAQVIHLIRDVRDYCASVRRAWGKDIRRAAFRWGQDVASAHRACEAWPTRCLQVRYEELLSAPRAQMSSICRFLDIPFTETMTTLRRSTEAVGDAAGRKEIVRSNFNKFESSLTRRELKDVESLAFNTMRTLGMQPLCAVGQREMGALEGHARKVYDGVQLLRRNRASFGVAGALRFHLMHRRVAD